MAAIYQFIAIGETVTYGLPMSFVDERIAFAKFFEFFTVA
jgi:hypothetical protein